LIDAYLGLMREGVTFPTSRQIATKSGRCERAVFEHFSDIRGLSAAALDDMFKHVGRVVPLEPHDGPLSERLKAYVEQHSAICELWLPLWRAAASHEQRSQPLTDVLERVRGVTTDRILLLFEPELAAMAPEDAREMVITIELLVDFESWVHLRERCGLPVEAARSLWTRALEQIVPVAKARRAAA
jgi:hypothetical protein